MKLSVLINDSTIRVYNVCDYGTAASAADSKVDAQDDGNEDDEVLVALLAVMISRSSPGNSDGTHFSWSI